MRTDELFLIDGVVAEQGSLFPDIRLSSGEVLWLETENDLQADAFISLVLGLLEIKKGRAFLAGSSLKRISGIAVSHVDISRWNPKTDSLGSLVKLMAHAGGFQVSAVMNEFKRILSGLGGEYALSVSLEEMSLGTRRIVSTAASLSMPRLLVMLMEPFAALDPAGASFAEEEIKRLSLDGSSFIILSGSEPPIYTKHKSFQGHRGVRS